MKPSTSTRPRFAPSVIAVHWAMFVLFVGVFAFIELRVLFAKGTELREAFKTIHFMLGLSVLALTLLRVALRLRAGTPPISPMPPRWQHRAAQASHLLLYAWMLAMPLAGWLLLSAEGKSVTLLGLELPALTGKDKALAAQLKELHQLAGRIGYGLIALHAAAALWHHRVMRDDTLLRMLPRRAVELRA
jgi:cytochrome b561